MILWDKIIDLITAGTTLATKAIPSDAERLERLKLNYPRIYARAKKHILKQAYHWMKQHKESDIDNLRAYVNLISNDPDDRKNLLELLNNGVKK